MSAYQSRIPPETSAEGAPDHDAPPHDGQSESVSQVMGRISGLVAELKDYAAYYAAAKADGIKWSITRIAVLAVLGLIGLTIGAAALVAATVLFIVGLANGLGRAFEPDMIWLGWLIVGGLLLLATGIGAVVGLKALTRSTQKRMMEKYENKRRRQQVELGTDVRNRAASAPESVGPA